MRDTVRDYYEGRVAGPRVGTPWATGPASLVVGRTVPFSYEEHGWREYIHLWMDPVAVYPRPETAIPSLGGPLSRVHLSNRVSSRGRANVLSRRPPLECMESREAEEGPSSAPPAPGLDEMMSMRLRMQSRTCLRMLATNGWCNDRTCGYERLPVFHERKLMKVQQKSTIMALPASHGYIQSTMCTCKSFTFTYVLLIAFTVAGIPTSRPRPAPPRPCGSGWTPPTNRHARLRVVLVPPPMSTPNVIQVLRSIRVISYIPDRFLS
jgi:hypothetical protein